MWAVGSPSVIMITCLRPVCDASNLRANASACCMLVPHSKSHVASGRRSGFTSRATRPKLTIPR